MPTFVLDAATLPPGLAVSASGAVSGITCAAAGEFALGAVTVKDSAGKETTVYWSDQTKVAGDEMKEGALVHWKGMEKDGKMWATWVHVGEMKKM